MPLGAQRPRLAVAPPGAVSSAGPEAVDLAASAGLVLDDWQRWVLEGALAERADGQYAAPQVCLICPRQNGKGAILEALELAGLFLFGEELVVHTAHKFATARDHFRRMMRLIDGCDDLRRKVHKVATANGNESIETRTGARLLFVARHAGATRGFSPDRIVFDEAYELGADAAGAMLPSMAARPNPQAWFTSSSPKPHSEVLHGLRARALGDTPGRLWFAEWSCEPGVDIRDRAAWAQANPGLGVRITDEFLAAQVDVLADLGDEFAREHLGVASMPDAGAGVFEAGAWAGCADPGSEITGPPAVALDVAPGMTFATIAGAGRRADGLVHVEIIERAPGTGWVVPVAARVVETNRTPIWVDPKSPAVALVDDLRAAGIDVRELPAGQFPHACVAFQRAVIEGTLRHLGDRILDQAQAGASVRTWGDAWVWTRASSAVDISPLVAVTIAHHQVAQTERAGDALSLIL